MHLDVKQIIAAPQAFDEMMRNRNEDLRSDKVIDLYNQWKEANQSLESVSAALNKLSKDFNKDAIDQCKQLSAEKKQLEAAVHTKRHDLDYVLDRLPNWLDQEVPTGANSDDNVVIGYYNAKPELDNPKHHEDIGIELGFWCREEAAALSGSRFIMLKDKLAKLERILIQFAMDYNTSAGFIEMSVPFIVNQAALCNTGDLPKFSDDYFAFQNGQALIPTGEVSLVNYCANKTLDIKELPLKLTTHTPCFRKEAGSLGKDTKGLIRLHQFHKVELVAITTREASHTTHLELLEHIKNLFDQLDLHYRVVDVCSGDIGFKAVRQFDIEVWMPGQNKYVEIASCSNCRDFQARRMKAKYTDEHETHFVHTLNSTSIACGRIIAAILENYCSDGTFNLPQVLHRYW